MAAHTRVLNVTRNCWMKQSQALRAIENCAYAWEEFGVSIRALTVAEAIAARNEQARLSIGLIYWVEGKDGKMIAKPYSAEIPGVVFQPPARAEAATRNELRLAWEANRFAAQRA